MALICRQTRISAIQECIEKLIASLFDPDRYPHPVDQVKLVETHISWVLLAGDFAYKIKKPVDFGFLDFSTLAKRRHFCAEEIRLNRRFAPQLYLDVIGIGGTPGNPILGKVPAFEYAVKMRRFPRSAELDLLLQQQCLRPEQMRCFADYIAKIHQQAAVADRQQNFGSLASVNAPVRENFIQLLRLLADTDRLEQVAELENWSRTSFDVHRVLLEQRREEGFIRECHGDLHLANMLWLDEQPILFDCIEFNDNFRWIDILCDIAFLLMDLDDRGATSLGWHFLNRYLQQTGDYQGVPLLKFYKVYRAMVRAKVTGLRLSQAALSAAERAEDDKLLQSYLDLATGYRAEHKPSLIICHGLSGSGKSTWVEQLAPVCPAITLHSDIERKRLHGLHPTAASRSELGSGIYTMQANQQTYRRLQELAAILLDSELTVIVDATFNSREQRKKMQQLAAKVSIRMVILDFPVSVEELFRRVGQRAQQAEQVSEADYAVLRRQIEQSQPLTEAEKKICIQVQPESCPEEIAARIKS